MATFSAPFNPTGPVGSDYANKLDSFIREDTKVAINERLALEHQDMETGSSDPDSPTAQGRHIPGKVGVLFVGSWDGISALTGMGLGSLVYCNYPSDKVGFYYRSENSGWVPLALSANEYTVDSTLVITSGDPNKLSMNHNYQQWTETKSLSESSGSIATDCNLSNSFEITLNSTGLLLSNPTNPQHGATYLWIIKQGSGGSKTLSYGDMFAFPGGLAPVLSTEAGAVDIITGIYNSTSSKFFCSVMYDVK